MIKDGLIEDLSSLTQYNYKVVHLTASAEVLSQIDSRLNLKESLGHTHSYYYQGEVNDLIQILGEYRVENILIEDPSLDEIFLQYYREK